VSIGLQPLGLSTDGRDGFLYVPPTYRASHPAPLIILLHGAGRSSTEWSNTPLSALFDDLGIVVLGPDSRGPTWDLGLGGFGPDVQFIDRALSFVFDRCAIDSHHVALGGFSDGASYALSLGVGNGDLFSALCGFSPGYFIPERRLGKPRIFLSHGDADPVLPIEFTRDLLRPALQKEGYDVLFTQFSGVHTVTFDVAKSAMRWFVTGTA
jgi:phospholipase/carboxylesterase